MGRRRIRIEKIEDERVKQITFVKRKAGLMKKAYELSVLCECEVVVICFNSANKLYQYSSENIDQTLLRYSDHTGSSEIKTNEDYKNMYSEDGDDDNEDGDDDDTTINTPSEAASEDISESSKPKPSRKRRSKGKTGVLKIAAANLSPKIIPNLRFDQQQRVSNSSMSVASTSDDNSTPRKSSLPTPLDFPAEKPSFKPTPASQKPKISANPAVPANRIVLPSPSSFLPNFGNGNEIMSPMGFLNTPSVATAFSWASQPSPTAIRNESKKLTAQKEATEMDTTNDDNQKTA